MPPTRKPTKARPLGTKAEREDYTRRFCAAIRDCQQAKAAGQVPNFSAVAAEHNIARTTLRENFLGNRKDRRAAHAMQQLLDPLEEEALVDWAILRAAAGKPLSREATMRRALLMTGKTPGTRWFDNFSKRNSDMLRVCRAYGLDPKRAQNFNKATVVKHFRELREVSEKYGIPLENIYNMDEKGIQHGGGRKHDPRKYLFARDDVRKYKLKSDDLELVTIIEATCADGTDCIPASFIAKPGDLGNWFEPAFPNRDKIGFVAASENGWTNDILCQAWFEKVFVPAATARNTSGKPILLIFDGHGSHVTDMMLAEAWKSNVILFLLPAKTSHMLQPLDVGIFNHVQRHWQDRAEARAVEQNPIRKEDVIREYLDIRSAAFTPQHVQDAWRRSGIHPHNPDIFTDDHFAPSQNTSTVVPVPESLRDSFEHVQSSDEEARATSDVEWDPDAHASDSGDESGDDDESGEEEEGELVIPRTPSPVPERIRNPTSSTRRMQEQQRGGSVPPTPTRIRMQPQQPRADSLPPSSPPPPSPPRPARAAYAVPGLPAYTRDVYRRDFSVSSSSSSRRTPQFSTSNDAPSSGRFEPAAAFADGRVTRARYAQMARRGSVASTGDEMEENEDEREREMRWMRERIAFLEEENHLLRGATHSANAHVTLMRLENGEMRTVFENKAKKKAGKAKRGKGGSTVLSVKQGALTVPEMFETWQAGQKAAAEEEERDKEQQATKERKAKEEADEQRRIVRDPNYRWDGTWASFKSGPRRWLVTMADDLSLEFRDKTKNELITAVEQHFADHPDLKTKPRYESLWAGRSRRRGTAASAATVAQGRMDVQAMEVDGEGAGPAAYNRASLLYPPVYHPAAERRTSAHQGAPNAAAGPGPSTSAARSSRGSGGEVRWQPYPPPSFTVPSSPWMMRAPGSVSDSPNFTLPPLPTHVQASLSRQDASDGWPATAADSQSHHPSSSPFPYNLPLPRF